MKIDKNTDFFIFDLGGVIIDLDIPFTINQLQQIALKNSIDLYEDFMNHPVHHAYEKGEIDDQTFRDELKLVFKHEWPNQEVDDIWNGMLGKIPQEKIQLLKDLRKTHPIYMLSNTNGIHFRKVEEILLEGSGHKSFEELFDRVFLSFEMGCRKPDTVIYEKVLAEIGQEGSRGVFFDDNASNIVGARKAGLRAHHIDHPTALLDYFANVH
ncbi:haloacid dehalogenase [Echinicola pacifica]|uniref:Haloacid dehalogenase n=1 Tax=Echinicola pacifica TaxID=346377 RepID=A0A918PJG4_9BACT|nr:HAD family phosphatase [Echinicola pacifica]GGZ13033.1 haloacid dehalogenase [Echinicola pacifica]